MALRSTKRVIQLVSLLAIFYMLVCIYMWATQRHKIFLPEPQLQTTPDRNGMRYEEVRIPSGNGMERGELHGWWIPAEQTNAATLLYLHGNFRNIGHNVEHALRLHNLGYNLLLVDYRGYGLSTGGKPSEAKVYEDAEAIWNYLLKVRGALPQRTFIYGHSLGGAVAIDLAVHHPEAAGLIVESTFTSMTAMGKRDYPYLPISLLLNQRFDGLDKISRLKIPVLFIHGTWDEKIPYQMSEQLFDKSPQPKYLKLIEGGEHGNSGGIAWLEYRAAVSEFVQRHVGRAP